VQEREQFSKLSLRSSELSDTSKALRADSRQLRDLSATLCGRKPTNEVEEQRSERKKDKASGRLPAPEASIAL
jgi:hypothetical protein